MSFKSYVFTHISKCETEICMIVEKEYIHTSHSTGSHYNGVIMSAGVSNHRRHDCLPSRLFSHRSKEISKLRATGLCVGNSPVTAEFPAQRASKAEMFLFDDVITGLPRVTKISLTPHSCLCGENAMFVTIDNKHGDHMSINSLNIKTNPSIEKNSG